MKKTISNSQNLFQFISFTLKWVQFSFKQRPILSAAPEELKIMQALGALIRENTEIETFSKQKKNIKKEGYLHVEQSLLIQNSDKFDILPLTHSQAIGWVAFCTILIFNEIGSHILEAVVSLICRACSFSPELFRNLESLGNISGGVLLLEKLCANDLQF